MPVPVPVVPAFSNSSNSTPAAVGSWAAAGPLLGCVRRWAGGLISALLAKLCAHPRTGGGCAAALENALGGGAPWAGGNPPMQSRPATPAALPQHDSQRLGLTSSWAEPVALQRALSGGVG